MINQQMDIYFVQKDFQTKQYKRYENIFFYHRII